MPSFVFAILAVAVSLAAEATENAKELEQLAGTWKVLSQVRDGKERDVIKENLAFDIRIDGSCGYTWTVDNQTLASASVFQVDSTKKPKTIDEKAGVATYKTNANKPQLGIYQLDGDTLMFCAAAPGKDRPTEFASKEGSGYTLTILKRSKQ